MTVFLVNLHIFPRSDKLAARLRAVPPSGTSSFKRESSAIHALPVVQPLSLDRRGRSRNLHRLVRVSCLVRLAVGVVLGRGLGSEEGLAVGHRGSSWVVRHVAVWVVPARSVRHGPYGRSGWTLARVARKVPIRVATWGVVCHSTKSSECVQRLSFESTSILMMVNDKTVVKDTVRRRCYQTLAIVIIIPTFTRMSNHVTSTPLPSPIFGTVPSCTLLISDKIHRQASSTSFLPIRSRTCGDTGYRYRHRR
jgi:hypothetical protein